MADEWYKMVKVGEPHLFHLEQAVSKDIPESQKDVVYESLKSQAAYELSEIVLNNMQEGKKYCVSYSKTITPRVDFNEIQYQVKIAEVETEENA